MDYKLIILDNIYDNINSPIVQEMLHPIFQAKKNGYSSRQSDSFLSICGDDMIGTQIAICREHEGKLTPISLAKVITSDVFKRYNLEHTMISAIKGYCSDSYLDNLTKYIDSIHASGGITTYSGGFTINRNAVLGKEEIDVLKEIYCGVHTLLHEHKGIHTMLGYASPKLKTDKLFETWGIDKLILGGEIPLVAPKVFDYQEYYPMVAKVSELSFYAKRMANKYLDLWDTRYDTSKVEVTEAA